MKRIGQRSVDAAKRRKRAMKKADAALSRYLRASVPYCVICGSRDRLQAGHLISRGKHSVRFDLRNVFTVCSKHNLLHKHYPEIMTGWYIKKFGAEAYEALVLASNSTYKWTADELDVIAEKFGRAV